MTFLYHKNLCFDTLPLSSFILPPSSFLGAPRFIRKLDESGFIEKVTAAYGK
jgi:hypothetical protein